MMGSEGSSQEEGSSTGSLWLLLHFLPIFLSLVKLPFDLGLWAPSRLDAQTYLWGLESWVMTSLPLTRSLQFPLWGWKLQHPDG